LPGDDEQGLQQGIFNLAIIWVQSLTGGGMVDEQAREEVAGYLDRISAALRDFDKQEKVILDD
jgi:hypothetical protein